MRHPASIVLAIALLLTTAADAREQRRHEPYYAAIWCAQQGGQSEVRLASGNRADCITETHAIEVDWARKFRQGSCCGMSGTIGTGSG